MSDAEKQDLIATERRLKMCVLIPTFNNAGTLRRVLTDVLEYSEDVIVVNDGSTDSTEEILDSFGDRIIKVSYPDNRGKGHALKAGFRKAIETGYEYAVTLDSDGQHYPQDMPLFVKTIAENYGALIIGQRDLSRVDINGKSSFANKFSNFWFCVQTGRNLKDTQTGYRAYPLRRLAGLSMLTSRYEAELELLVFAAWKGVEIIPIPIRVYYPPQSERVSHFRPALDFTRISILNTNLCVAAILYGWPARLVTGFSQKRFFTGDFHPFTHKKGKRRDAAVTLSRIIRSFYGFSYFGGLSMFVFSPFASLYFGIGKTTEKKRIRFHKMMQESFKFLIFNFPGCKAVTSNPGKENFEKPALIICNHQSPLDLPVLMSVTPKMVFLTNDRVWNNPIYRNVIHKAEFLPVSAGFEALLPKLRNLKERGYSIVVFPEGTRSADCSILRFHQGAFYLARELDLDIIPMTLHGLGHFLPKHDDMLRSGEITLSIMPRVAAGSHSDLPLRQEASLFRKMIRAEYDRLAAEKETDRYFHPLVKYKYAYRGWKTMTRCKKILRESGKYSEIISSGSTHKGVRIINSGIGTFALLYALANRSTPVYAFESNRRDYDTAVATAGLPANLHYIHAVSDSDFAAGAEDCDLTIILDGIGSDADTGATDETIRIPLKS